MKISMTVEWPSQDQAKRVLYWDTRYINIESLVPMRPHFANSHTLTKVISATTQDNKVINSIFEKLI